jgi:hypothetical protein
MHGRLRNTARFIAVTTYGARDEAEAAIARVRRIHDHVNGTLPDGTPYDANDPRLLAFVHLAGSAMFLAGYRRFADPAMPLAERDAYWREVAIIGEKLNVAHHYDLSDRLYELFLDATGNIAAPISPIRRTASSRRSRQEGAHRRQALPEAGQRVLDIGCGWGGMALYLNRVADVDVLGVTLSEEQLPSPAARGGGRRRPTGSSSS